MSKGALNETMQGMFLRSFVLLMASLGMINPLEGKHAMPVSPVPTPERTLVYEGMADQGRIRLELRSSGNVNARYENHPRVISKETPWSFQAQFNPHRIASLVDKAASVLQQDPALRATNPLSLQPGMEVTLKSVTVTELETKKTLAHLSFMDTPETLKSTLTEIQKVYLELKNARKREPTAKAR